MSAKRAGRLALLTAAALIIFIVELRIPNLVRIPGIKLGLANIVTVYAVYHCNHNETFLIVLSRIFLGAFFAGNFISVIYSLCGALLCLVGMFVFQHFIDESLIWVSSVLGAVLHNMGQIAAAVIIMKTTAVISYLPFLIVSGCIAGAFTGVCAQILIKRVGLDKDW